MPREVRDITEPAAVEMAKLVRLIPVHVPGRAQPVLTSCIGGTPLHDDAPDQLPPFILLHGFDSSCLEYRRLFPLLSRRTETWALDILGWGFTDGQDGGVGDYSPAAKRAHLYAFWAAHVRRPMILCGASLGGAAAIDFAVHHPEAVDGLVLVDAQGFIDGIGPMGALPRPIAKIGVNVLRTNALRTAANKMAYFNTDRFATEDAQRVGRLHTFAPQWCDATLSFMRSGGFRVVEAIARVPQPALVLWGRNDKILEPTNATRFQTTLPNATLRWIESCGHVPHLEQPEVTAEALLAFAAEQARRRR